MSFSLSIKQCLTILSCSGAVTVPPACSDPEAPGDGGGPKPPAVALTTFNVGLAPGLSPLVAERGSAAIEAIATDAAAAAAAAPSEISVLCVQEFWVEEHWSALVAATAETFSSSLRMPVIPGVGRCSPEELEPLGVCLAANCDVPAEEILVCGQTECAAEVAAISGVCLPCVIDNAASGLEAIAAACINPEAGPQEREPAIYGGAVNLGLLTNARVEASDTTELDSYFVRAGVLYANLDDGTGAHLHVFCTHLASPLPGIPYQGAHGDYEGEQNAQLTQLLSFIDEKTAKGDRVVLLGDFNTGPAAGDLFPEFPAHFARLLRAGFTQSRPRTRAVLHVVRREYLASGRNPIEHD